MIKLLGIAVIVVGFAARWNALLVIVLAGMTTGLLAGFSFRELIQMIGQLFIENRGLTLPVALMVPIVGLLERHGLKERVGALMRQVKAATPGGVIWLYQVIRELSSMVGISIGNHASMVRPLVVPMAEARVAETDLKEARPLIRANAAAAENAGNFFADDIFVAVGALLLVHGTLQTAGVEVTLRDVQVWSAPTAVWVIALGWWRRRALDARLAALAKAPGQKERQP